MDDSVTASLAFFPIAEFERIREGPRKKKKKRKVKRSGPGTSFGSAGSVESQVEEGFIGSIFGGRRATELRQQTD